MTTRSGLSTRWMGEDAARRVAGSCSAPVYLRRQVADRPAGFGFGFGLALILNFDSLFSVQIGFAFHFSPHRMRRDVIVNGVRPYLLPLVVPEQRGGVSDAGDVSV